jgi:hypothetical protein
MTTAVEKIERNNHRPHTRGGESITTTTPKGTKEKSMATKIEYKLRNVEPKGSPTGKVTIEEKSETLPTLKAAEARAEEVLKLDNVYGSVQFWDENGTHAGVME